MAPAPPPGEAEQILGVQKERSKGKKSSNAGKGKKSPAKKKPKGMSNEAWQLQQDSTVAAQQAAHAPLMPADNLFANQAKEPQWRSSQLSNTIHWVWRPFKNSARSDGLQLKHWARVASTDATGSVTTPTETTDGDYVFTKFDKPVDMVHYSDDEYARCVENETSTANEWSKAETDRLFQLLELFNMNFVLVHDRWDLGTNRSIEELKQRYYDVAKRIVRSRSESEKKKAPAHATADVPFNKAHEESRKNALERLFARTNADEHEEAAVLTKAQQIEERRKRENSHVANMGNKLSNSKGMNIDMASVSSDEVQKVEHPLGPRLPVRNSEPNPGAYLRKRAFISVSNEVLNANTKGQRGTDRLDATLEQLGVRPYPDCASHAVCDMWTRLRKELAELYELRKQVAAKHQRLNNPQQFAATAGGGAPQVQHQQPLAQPQQPAAGANIAHQPGTGATATAAPTAQNIMLPVQQQPTASSQPKKQGDLKRKGSQNESLFVNTSQKKKRKH